MIEVTFLLPLRDNEGKAFSSAHHWEAEKILIALNGGVTMGAEVTGAWEDVGGRLYRDELIPAVVAVDNLLLHGREIVEAAEALALHYRQHAIAVRYLGQMEIIQVPAHPPLAVAVAVPAAPIAA